MKIGLIGCGSIGQFLLEKINKDKLFPHYKVSAVFDAREKSVAKLKELSEQYQFESFQDLDAFLDSDIDVVVECANIQFVNDYATKIVERSDLLLISIGALANTYLYDEITSIAKTNGNKVYLPAGAIGGLDIVKAANVMGGLHTVKLVSRKPSKALSGELIANETILFEGTAREAIEKFPKNANVAIALSLAGIGIEKTAVIIIADPNVDKNIHTIQVNGEFGQTEITISNNPSPTNPKTSYLTSLSILSALQSLKQQISIG
ncbi:aspartate dehydrogenase [Sporosarcina ureilytica]|uniref:L-aspartate dehydrogenase n=1 Tax=Sporosarcina ureilytica TaxID=298596 RepID=A0A1D8JJT0_9BACL|nr:aspartate dehydrogenase [Sporosarcina ureilytica]AOV08940.1 aspartate dehydrogenase [Sporosarcina ureilytica]